MSHFSHWAGEHLPASGMGEKYLVLGYSETRRLFSINQLLYLAMLLEIHAFPKKNS